MRKYAYIESESEKAKKIMISTKGNEVINVFVYLYETCNDIFPYDTEGYANLECAEGAWEDHISRMGWIPLKEQISECEECCFLPVRKRNGILASLGILSKYQVCDNGKWVKYSFKENK